MNYNVTLWRLVHSQMLKASAFMTMLLDLSRMKNMLIFHVWIYNNEGVSVNLIL